MVEKTLSLYKGAEKVFYNINSIVGYDTGVIVEGEMDVLALHEAGIKMQYQYLTELR
jgi:DNA primase